MPNLITVTDMQATVGLNKNVESRKVDPWIVEAQRRLEKIMGRTGYAQMVSDGTSHASWTGLWTGYIKEFLCWQALELAYPSLYADADRQGVYTVSTDKHESVDSKTLGMLSANARGARETAQARLLDHITENLSTYTWFGEQQDNEERITNNVGGAGIIMRRSARQDQYRG